MGSDISGYRHDDILYGDIHVSAQKDSLAFYTKIPDLSNDIVLRLNNCTFIRTLYNVLNLFAENIGDMCKKFSRKKSKTKKYVFFLQAPKGSNEEAMEAKHREQIKEQSVHVALEILLPYSLFRIFRYKCY